MDLFTPGLFRSFAVGFALGALALFATVRSDVPPAIGASVVPAAVAASVK